MIKCVFLGNQHVASAYPDSLRAEVTRWAEIIGPDIPSRDWRDYEEYISKANVIFSSWGMPKLTDEFLSMASSLNAVFYAAGTVKGFATEEAYDRGILIHSAWGANAVPVAEYTLATILLSLKSVWRFSRSVREQKTFCRPGPLIGAYQAKIGLVSLGAVGKLVARKLGAFDLDLIAYDPFVDPEAAQELGVSMASIEEVFSTCDVVSLHTPWLPETENLVGERLLDSMSPGATFINTSRGAVVNEADLCKVLQRREDLTAVLDVTYPEPPKSDSMLYTLSNVVLTPHIAGSGGNEIARMGRWMVDEFARFVDGHPPKHVVTREMLERMA